MRVTVEGYKQDSDVNFNLYPDTAGERALLRAMNGRKCEVHPEEGVGDSKVLTLRCVVVGKRN